MNPDRRFANVLSPLALHQIARDEYISYPLLSLSLSRTCTGWAGSLFTVRAHNEGLSGEIILTVLQAADRND